MSTRVIIEAEGFRMVIDEENLDSFGLSLPSDVYRGPDGDTELGRSHVSLTGIFKQGFRPEWEEIT
jgi:hypothetical protein